MSGANTVGGMAVDVRILVLGDSMLLYILYDGSTSDSIF